ncbi:MAG: hypothetical protein HC886_04625 [Leptolyngbyaceae cyanobacterium SM1_1_3]|nr:hypothetical protein [Leptolyngbyaceae cyanobacterium SM1_1_3]NJN04200.1 hypothetical protein [Leptolyngbyaceae cyanobacterium RM1_1_2]NJO08329.1 hypothetical protein [Leptolyngbyaceae cyanobacterium SL_1_1]
MPTIDALISITFYGGLGYIGAAAVIHAFHWTNQRLLKRQTLTQVKAVEVNEPVAQTVETEQPQVVMAKPPVKAKAKQKVTQPVYASL